MAPSLASQWRSFWHTMTSNDRHASHDSPYRTGQHVPLPQSKHGALTNVATSALESRADLNSGYDHDLESGHGFANSGPGTSSPKSPQVRTSLQRAQSNMEAVDSGEIQMQSFSDGLPPPPPVAHSWKRIDRWLEDNYEELWENVCEGATLNDVNELENDLDCTLPQEVRESIQIHDGQERGGQPTGVIFGCMLLDCEEIIQEWQNWRKVNENYLSNDRSYEIPQAPIKAFAGASSSSSAVPIPAAQQSANPHWRQELLDKQDSQPPNAVQKSYAHPAWIPLARDWGGNNIAIDLAPGPTGKWGQVILMGRDYDCKYVIARSWSAFLATVADDMNTDKWFINEENGELKLREFKQQGVEPAYIDILRWRADQKFGRKGPKKRLSQPLRINSQVAGQMNGFSPYASPTSSAPEDRGRSPNRFPNSKAPATSSPRAHVGSPLARVAEEERQPQPLRIETGLASPPPGKDGKLVSIDSPLPPPVASSSGSDDFDRRTSLPKSRLGDSSLSGQEGGAASAAKDRNALGGAEDEMKNVEI